MKSIANYGARHDRMSIADDSFFEMPILLPPFPEQHAIAEILSTADKLIAVKERLIAAKQKQKRWLMQNLLMGNMRLPGFSGEWEKTYFEELFTERSFFTNNIENNPLYSLTIENGVIAKTERYERSHLILKDEAYKIVYPNDYVYNPMNVRFGALARYKGIISVSVSGYYNVFKCNNEADCGFFDSYLTSPYMITYYNKVSAGSLVEKQRVHFSQFINFRLPLPSSDERLAIAKILTTADREIELLSKDLEQQKQIKKYLMQQLLTGKRRIYK
jgi:type I restriction enzyme S subunit